MSDLTDALELYDKVATENDVVFPPDVIINAARRVANGLNIRWCRIHKSREAISGTLNDEDISACVVVVVSCNQKETCDINDVLLVSIKDDECE